jgi:rare lipoprotein A
MMFYSKRLSHRWSALSGSVAAAMWLAGCASGPGVDLGGARPPVVTVSPGKDGPPDRPPADLTQVPDAVPKVEPIVPSGPNKPYVVEGQSYEPIAVDVPFKQRGTASWYGAKFHGRRTASGELYSMYGMTAAHRTLPIPSYARVRAVATGKSVIVRINDRGPFHSARVLDLSYTAAAKLDVLGRGTVEVEIERLTFDQIRSGQWRNDAGGAPVAAAGASASAVVQAPADGVYALASRLDGARPQVVESRSEPLAAPLPPARAKAVPVVNAVPRSVAEVVGTLPPALPEPVVSEPVASPAPTSPTFVPVPKPVVAPAAASAPASAASSSIAVAKGPALAASAPLNAPPVAPVRPAQEVKGRAYTTVAKGFWVQLAAFSKKEGVDAFQQRASHELADLASLLAVFHEDALYRLQVGPYAKREDAQSAAQRIRDALKLVPMVVERQ